VRQCTHKLSHYGVHPNGSRTHPANRNCGSSNCLEKRFTIPVCKYVGRISGLKHLIRTRFAGKELQSGEKMERAIQPEIPSPSCGADERPRQHREASTRTRLKPHSCCTSGGTDSSHGRAVEGTVVDTEFRESQTSQRGQQAKATSGGQNGGGGFFRSALQRSRLDASRATSLARRRLRRNSRCRCKAV